MREVAPARPPRGRDPGVDSRCVEPVGPGAQRREIAGVVAAIRPDPLVQAGPVQADRERFRGCEIATEIAAALADAPGLRRDVGGDPVVVFEMTSCHESTPEDPQFADTLRAITSRERTLTKDALCGAEELPATPVQVFAMHRGPAVAYSKNGIVP